MGVICSEPSQRESDSGKAFREGADFSIGGWIANLLGEAAKRGSFRAEIGHGHGKSSVLCPGELT